MIAALIALVIFVLDTDSFLSEVQPLLPFILILTAFICTLIGNVMVM
ncbi:hypothetical protein GW750_00765 [bacterium]|nr:hypothetical protein [bacterium]